MAAGQFLVIEPVTQVMDPPELTVHIEHHGHTLDGLEGRSRTGAMLEQVPDEGITLVVPPGPEHDGRIAPPDHLLDQRDVHRILEQDAQGMLRESPGVVAVYPHPHVPGA